MRTTTLVDAFGRPLERFDASEEHADAWANPATGIGATGLDKSRAARYLPVWRVLDQELTSLMNGSDIAAKIVGKRPEEMFRRGFEIESDDIKPTQIDDLRDYATEYLDLETQFLEGMRWGRGYGGCLLYMNIDDGRDPVEPLDENNIRSFDSMSLVDRRYSYVQSQYASMGGSPAGKYGRPQIYLLSNAVAGYGWNSFGARKIEPIAPDDLRKGGAYVSLVHESRVIRFDGNATDIVTRQNLAGWSWSVLQRVYDVLRQADGAFDSVMYLLQDASQGVFKMKGLMKAISAGKRSDFEARLMLLERTRSVMRGIALDADGGEDFTRVPTPFGGIPELIDRVFTRVAAAADMPQTELWGRSPQGLNATGESDTRKWYDTIQTEAENQVSPKVKRVFKLLSLAKNGPVRAKKAPSFKVHWKPLWSPTDKELAETRFANAQRDNLYITNGTVKPEEVAVDLVDVYPNLDVDARQEVLEAGIRFDPYENEPSPEGSSGIAGKTLGEPLSPSTPTALMGVSGQGVNPNSPGAKQPARKPTPANQKVPAPAPAKEPAPKNAPKKDALDPAVEGVPDPNAQPDAAVAVVVRRNGQILAVLQRRGPRARIWCLPGGHVETADLETSKEAALRELEEETQLRATNATFLVSVVAPDGAVVHAFLVTEWEGRPLPDRDEVSDVEWLRPAELLAQAGPWRASAKAILDTLPPRGSRVDEATALVLDALTEGRPDAKQARAVFQQLLDDYPANKLGWVLASHWEGPQEIPLDQIDSSNRDKWTASHDGKIESFAEKIRDGVRKPAILVKVPNDPKLKIVDGHHRFLGHEANDLPLLAYVAEMHVTNGPWDELHAAQKKGKSGPRSGSWTMPSWQTVNAPKNADLTDDSQDVAELPNDFGTEVPEQGSSCDDCRFRRGVTCINDTFVAWSRERLHLPVVDGAVRIPAPDDDMKRYCCSAWQAAPGVLDSQGLAFPRDEETMQPTAPAPRTPWYPRATPGTFAKVAQHQVVTTPHGEAHVQLAVHPTTGEHTFTARARKDDGSMSRPMHVTLAKEHVDPEILTSQAMAQRRVALSLTLPQHTRAQAHALAEQLDAHANDLRIKSTRGDDDQ